MLVSIRLACNLTGEGRCRRDAASLSPGASNATTGAPNVTPINEARDPPSECPAVGVRQAHGGANGDGLTYKPDVCVRVHVRDIVI